MAEYTSPEIEDFGDLQELTLSCVNVGSGDEVAKRILATVPLIPPGCLP